MAGHFTDRADDAGIGPLADRIGIVATRNGKLPSRVNEPPLIGSDFGRLGAGLRVWHHRQQCEGE